MVSVKGSSAKYPYQGYGLHTMRIPAGGGRGAGPGETGGRHPVAATAAQI